MHKLINDIFVKQGRLDLKNRFKVNFYMFIVLNLVIDYLQLTLAYFDFNMFTNNQLT